MVNINNVYQKVLFIANKEQRGYITPQEFNTMADKAQLEIANNYVHELKMAHYKKQNTSEISDPIEMLTRKIAYIKDSTDINVDNTDNTRNYGLDFSMLNIPQGPTPILYITNIMAHIEQFNVLSGMTLQPMVFGQDTVEILELDERQLSVIASNHLIKPTESKPVFVQTHSTFSNNTNTHTLNLKIFPKLDTNTKCRVEFIRRPQSPKWGYVVVNQKPLYNFNTSTNFEIHPSEEENLVTRILQLAGVIIEKADLVQGAYTDQQVTQQKQNS